MPRIFVVDDDIFTLKAIRRILARDNLEVDTCHDNEEAINILYENSYDLVLIDIVMPGRSGFDLCEIISKEFENLPIILMTALIDEDIIKKAFAKGATDFIRKPIRHAELYCRINRLINNKNNNKKIKSLNASMLEELRIATTVQEYLLPYWCTISDTTSISSFRYAANLITGNLFNYKIISDDKYLVYVAEAPGGSVKGALVFSAVNAILSRKISLNPKNSLKFLIKNSLNIINNAIESSAIIGIYDINENSFNYIATGEIPLFTINYKTAEIRQAKPVLFNYDSKPDEEDIHLNRIMLKDNEAITICSTGVFEAKNGNNSELTTNLFEKLVKENITKYNIHIIPYIVAYSITSNGFNFNADSSILTFFKFPEGDKNLIRIPRESFNNIKNIISRKVHFLDIYEYMKEDLGYLLSSIIKENIIEYLRKGFLIFVNNQNKELSVEFVYLTDLNPLKEFSLLKNNSSRIDTKNNKRFIEIYNYDSEILNSLRIEKLKVRVTDNVDRNDSLLL